MITNQNIEDLILTAVLFWTLLGPPIYGAITDEINCGHKLSLPRHFILLMIAGPFLWLCTLAEPLDYMVTKFSKWFVNNKLKQ